MAIQSESMSEPQTSILHKISIGINIFGIAGVVLFFITRIKYAHYSDMNASVDELKAEKNRLYIQMAITIAVCSLLTFIGYKYAIVSYILNLYSLPIFLFFISPFLGVPIIGR